MSSDDLVTELKRENESGGVRRLLDAVSGFFVWAIHFLVVYCTTAVACVLGLGAADSTAQSLFVIGLVVATLAAAAIVIFHALRAYWRREDSVDDKFLKQITIGHDALATVSILWQLFPILMTSLCV